MSKVKTRFAGLIVSISLGLVLLYSDTGNEWLLLGFLYFTAIMSIGLIFSSIFLGKKALYWGLIGILPLVIFFGVSAILK